MITDSDALAILEAVAETNARITALHEPVGLPAYELRKHTKHEFYANMAKELGNGSLREAVKKLAAPVVGCPWCETIEEAKKGST